ncbi:MAG TPA: hypothetical protein VH854_13565 [Thermoanaerobaculia bacterium]|jgi:hypothetical protein|nr:hypothetical protein [Thermoanaerobaculia bacterium]
MRSKVTLATLSALSLACGTLLFGTGCATTKLTPGGAAVKVYETDRRSGQPDATLPTGCRMLSAAAPFRQQASDRVNVKDPYRADRNATADRGGNVLLVRSSRIIDLKKTECPTTDRSPDCQGTDQSWYNVTLESYACDEPAVQALAASPSPDARSFWWPFETNGNRPAASAPASAAVPATAAAPAAPAAPVGLSASELKSKILSLMQEGVGSDVLVAYVKTQRVSAPLTAEEIVDWKRSGIVEPVIEAAIAQAPVH